MSDNRLMWWAIAGGVAFWIYQKKDSVNPFSDKNLAYEAANKALGYDNKTESIGTAAYDVSHSSDYRRTHKKAAAIYYAVPFVGAAAAAVDAARYITNPNENAGYKAANWAVGLDNETESIGTKIYDWLN